MKVSKLVGLYLSHVEKEHAPATYRSYEGRLRHFETEFGEMAVRKVRGKKVEEYLKARRTLKNGREAAPDTIRLDVVAVEQLQKYAITIGELKKEKPWIDRLPRPGGRRRERIPTIQEQAKIVRLAKAQDRAFAIAVRALWMCGARPSELAAAQIENFDRGASVIVLTKHKTARKTRKARRIGVGKKLRRIVDRLIGNRETGPIFRDGKGEPWTPGKISRRFSMIRNELGLSKDLVLYCLRHSFGTRVCRRFGLHAAATALGHTSVNMSQRYVHLSDEDLTHYQDGAS
jgi:integrase